MEEPTTTIRARTANRTSTGSNSGSSRSGNITAARENDHHRRHRHGNAVLRRVGRA